MKILIVVDMQNDLVTGTLSTSETQDIVPKVITRIQKAYKDGEKVIYTMGTHKESTYMESVEGRHFPVPHCIEGTKGWEMYPPILEVVESPDCIIKEYNAFGSYSLPDFIFTSIPEALYKNVITEITLIGLFTDINIISNAIILKNFFVNPTLPVEINVDASCCVGTNYENHKLALKMMETLHINILNRDS